MSAANRIACKYGPAKAGLYVSRLGGHEQLAAAWIDHRQDVPGTLEEATREAARLLQAHPGLVVGISVNG
jgi:hypothetical protein